jgi:TolB protein
MFSMKIRMRINKLAVGCWIALWLCAPLAHAALTIQIVGGGAKQTPIAISTFPGETALQQQITPVVIADLTRTGLFRMVDAGGINPVPTDPSQVQYPVWAARGAEALAIGSVTPLPDGHYNVQFRLLDVLQQGQLAGFQYNITPSQARLTAHKIADAIYKAITGDVGVFSTRIAYVLRQGSRYELQVADSDGYNPQTVLSTKQPIISPAWAPDGTRLAYVSFEKGHAAVYVQSLLTGNRHVVVNSKGTTSAPAWAPNGKQLVVAIAADGGTNLYRVNDDGSGLTPLTHGSAINTEPSFSPDGKSLLFTSDRGGSPQIYEMPPNGGVAQRLTFDGSYNVTPDYSPTGKDFAFVQRNSGHLNIAVEDFASHQVQVLTNGDLDQSPSFAPNGKMILYAAEGGILAAVSSDGRVKQRLRADTGQVSEPAWGPLPKTQ